MCGIYDLECRRAVASANLNGYRSPTLHPDRIMPEHDLVYIVEGSWEIWQNGVPYLVGKDDVILLHGGEHHYGVAPCESDTKTFYLHMSAEPLDMFCDREGFEKGKINTVTHCKNRRAVKPLFQSIVQTYIADGPVKNEKLSALCQLLLCELQKNIGHGEAGSDSAVDRVIDLIYRNPQKILTSREMAEEALTSERTLRNRFLESCGVTPYGYQMGMKFRNICAMLTDFPEMKLREIAINYGFYDEFHLSKAFKRAYGISPRQYREENGVVSDRRSTT